MRGCAADPALSLEPGRNTTFRANENSIAAEIAENTVVNTKLNGSISNAIMCAISCQTTKSVG